MPEGGGNITPSPSSSFKSYARNLRRNQTDAERFLWTQLRARQLGVKFRRQYAIGRRYIVDFCCLEHALIIELDGSQHRESIVTDERRVRELERLGFRLLRFWDNEVLTNMGGVLERLIVALERS